MWLISDAFYERIYSSPDGRYVGEKIDSKITEKFFDKNKKGLLRDNQYVTILNPLYGKVQIKLPAILLKRVNSILAWSLL